MNQQYNLVDEPWIYVEYLDGKKEHIGLRVLFRDAHLIKDLVTERFRNSSFVKYDFCLYRFLSVVVMDAYSQKELYDIDTKEELIDNKSFDEVIFEYLEHYYDRFNLFDEKYPFMQSTRDMMDSKSLKSSKGNALKINPVAIAESGRLYGKSAEAMSNIVDYYTASIIEYIYFLLYTNTCRISGGCAGNNGILGSQSIINIVLKGKNLFESVILNTIETQSGEYNKPLYRWTNIDEISDSFLKGTIDTIECLSGAFLPPLKIYGERRNIDNVEIFIENYDKKYKPIRDSIGLQWIELCEWGTLIYESDSSAKDTAPFGTTSIDDTTPLWFELVEYTDTSVKQKRYKKTPKSIKEIPENINSVSVDYYLTKTDSNSNFLYVMKKTQDNLPKNLYLKNTDKEILNVFIDDYKYIVSVLKNCISDFYISYYGKESSKRYINAERDRALRRLESKYDAIPVILNSNMNTLDECKIQFEKELYNDAVQIFEGIYYSQGSIVEFVNESAKLKRTIYRHWFSKEDRSDKRKS